MNSHKNREKNLQFNGVKQSKIQWTVLEIKFIKGKNFKEIWQRQTDQKVGLKIRKETKIEKKIYKAMN